VNAPRLSRLGDCAWLVAFEPRLDPGISRRVLTLDAGVRAAGLPGVRDIVPSASSLAVHVDPEADVEGIGRALSDLLAATDHGKPPEPGGRLVELPAEYGGDAGPDLAGVAARLGLAPEEVVRRHAAVEYRVYMLGFLPGFPYLGLLDPSIQVARHDEPRARVPRGSIGIASRMTGIYPVESPGGWQIIGRTPVALFDAAAPSPALLRPGDRVRFVPTAVAASSGVGRDA
jgi:KipI family sensor histidine kinase inhibitor